MEIKRTEEYKEEIAKLKDALNLMYEAYAREHWHRSENGLGNEEIEHMQAEAETRARAVLPELNKCVDCGCVVLNGDIMCNDCYRAFVNQQESLL